MRNIDDIMKKYLPHILDEDEKVLAWKMRLKELEQKYKEAENSDVKATLKKEIEASKRHLKSLTGHDDAYGKSHQPDKQYQKANVSRQRIQQRH